MDGITGLRKMRLSQEQSRILTALQQGRQLKVHRTVDGLKQYCLHAEANGETEVVGADVVARLETGGLIESNMKFPAATFLLTEKGAATAAQLTGSRERPTGPRNYR